MFLNELTDNVVMIAYHTKIPHLRRVVLQYFIVTRVAVNNTLTKSSSSHKYPHGRKTTSSWPLSYDFAQKKQKQPQLKKKKPQTWISHPHYL